MSSAINVVATAEASEQLWNKCIHLLQLFADHVTTNPLSQTLRLQDGNDEIFVQSFTLATQPDSEPGMYQVKVCAPGQPPVRWEVSQEDDIYETHQYQRDYTSFAQPTTGDILELCLRLDRVMPPQ